MTPRNLSVGVILVEAALLLSASPASADTFHMKKGGKVEGEIVKDLGDSYRVRVAFGTVDLLKDDIEKRVPGATPWQRYKTHKKKYPDTAAGQFELAEWCKKNGLADKRQVHLRRVLELDPGHVGARQALGFVKVEGAWVDRKSLNKPPPPTAEEQAEQERQALEKKLARQLVTKWFVRIRAITKGRLEGKSRDPSSAEFRDGRKQILAIRDPLALPALTSILSAGSEATRKVLIESLAQFPQDEATMNLLVVAVLDPSRDVRRLAAVELIPRNDDRIGTMLRDALNSKEEPVLRNAAEAAGILRDQSVIDALISSLSMRTRQGVQVTRPVFLQAVTGTFNGATVIDGSTGLIRYYPESIGVLAPGTLVGTVTTYEVQYVSVYRTEVQEALIEITGQNLGFDEIAWKRWWKQEQKDRGKKP